MWNQVLRNITPGQLMTPGRGIPPVRQKPFDVINITTNHIDIEIGASNTLNRLPQQMFDAVNDFFQNSPTSQLRIAAEHQVDPTPNSVDQVVRSLVHFPRAIGNYVAAILESAGCVRYVMVVYRKYIKL
jgi:hypothetical protein